MEDVGKSTTYLGLDLSTQQLKAVIVDDNLEALQEAKVLFDVDLPEFRTNGGCIKNKEDVTVVTAPTLMWVKALDILMDKLLVEGVDFSKIAAISGSAQQHGSVYWQHGAENKFSDLDPTEFLHQQLATYFSVQHSPIWMDSSTTKQCKELENAVGGPTKLAEITGSRGYERFTGAQISKIYQTKPESYANAERISLVSSFLCSLFLGKIAPIDYSDGSGMNLFNIHDKTWNQVLLNAAGPDLSTKLGDPVPSHSILGNVSSYFVDRWAFNPNCKVVAFTGDNPSSLLGMRLTDDWVAVSLGTSDTLMFWMKEAKIILDGHILCNPIDPEAYMGLLCFKNGSFTRERIRNNCAEGSWDIFNQLLDGTPRGNFGNMGLYYDAQEILPFLSGDHRYNKSGTKVSKFSSLEVEVRALIEGQFVAMRSYIEDLGFKIGADTKILATGGGANNKSILQVLADVFGSPVHVQKSTDSAMLGAAYQAKHAVKKETLKFNEVTSTLPQPDLLCTPYKDNEDIYGNMVKRYRNIVASLLADEENN